MSFEIGFLIVCLSILAIFIIALIISTVIMGSRVLLRMQHMFNSLKFDKQVDEWISTLIAKVEAGLLVATYNDKTIKFYTQDNFNKLGTLGRWDERDIHDAEIWVGNKFTQYGYITKYHSISRHDLQGKCGSYRTFRKLLAFEDAVSGRVKPEPVKKPEPAKLSKDPVELE